MLFLSVLILDFSTTSGQDEEIERLIGQLEGLSSDYPLRDLLSHPAVRRLVVLQKASAPRVGEYLASGRNPRGKIAAALVLRDTSYRRLLARGTEDSDPLVRNFTRQILRHKPRCPGDDCGPDQPYEVTADRVAELAPVLQGKVQLEGSERREWISGLIRELARDPLDPPIYPSEPTTAQLARDALAENLDDFQRMARERLESSQDPQVRMEVLRAAALTWEQALGAGRGVGPDKARAALEALGGQIERSLFAKDSVEQREAFRLALGRCLTYVGTEGPERTVVDDFVLRRFSS